MFQMLASEARRLRSRWQTILAFLLIVGFMIQGYIDYYTNSYNSIQHSAYMAYLSALGYGGAAYWVGILPLASCLITGDSLAWDRRSGIVRFWLIRVSRRQYIAQKILATSLFTALLFFVGFLVAFLIAIVWFPVTLPPWHMVNGVATLSYVVPEGDVYPFPTFFHNLFFAHPLVYALVVTLVVILSAVAWANLSLLLSIWTTNLYLVLGIPWLTYILLTFILAGPLLMPKYAPLVLSGPFVSESAGELGMGIPFIWLALIAGLAAVSSILFIYRKGRDILD